MAVLHADSAPDLGLALNRPRNRFNSASSTSESLSCSAAAALTSRCSAGYVSSLPTGKAQTYIVRPTGTEEIDREWADRSRLLAYEVFMGHMPLDCSGVFAVTCLLGPLDADDNDDEDGHESNGVEVLRSGLEALISARPLLAGRACGKYISLCNAGVPFTVSHHEGPRPASIHHSQVLAYCDVHEPDNVMSGTSPLLTIALRIYQDGATLGVAVSHSVMDGSSLFGFLNAWGNVCRGETDGIGSVGHRACLQKLLRTEERERTVDKIFRKLSNEDHVMAKFVRKVDDKLHASGSKIGASFCNNWLPSLLTLGKANERLQLSLTHAQLEEIKIFATPLPDQTLDGGDGWVSTQEAVVAHLVLCLWRITKRKFTTGGTARISFLLDARKALGVDVNLAFGTGFQVCSIFLAGMSEKGLKECAASIHEGSKEMTKSVPKSWCLWHRAFEYRVESTDFLRDLMNTSMFDMSLTINNNSKRQAPNFGTVAGGVGCEFMSNMGPTLFVATATGMDIILEGSLMSGASRDDVALFVSNFSRSPKECIDRCSSAVYHQAQANRATLPLGSF